MAGRSNTQAPQTVSEQVILSPEEYQMVLNARQQAQAPQQPVQQVAPTPQPAPIPQAAPQQIQQPVQQAPVQTAPQAQQIQPVDQKAEKKAKFLKAGKAVLKTTAIAGVGAAAATAVFLITRSDDAGEDAAEGAAALVGSWF